MKLVCRRAVSGAVLAASMVGVVACSDGNTEIMVPTSRIGEGTELVGVTTYSATVTQPNGSVLQLQLPKQHFSVRMSDGVAQMPQTALPQDLNGFIGTESIATALPAFARALAIADEGRAGVEQRTVTVTDSLGRLHRMQIAFNGRRLLSFRHEINGDIFAEIVVRWTQVNGAWVLEDKEARMYQNGQVVLRLGASNTSAPVALHVDPAGLLALADASLEALLVPQDAYASCLGAWAGVVGASIVAGSAIAGTGGVAAVAALLVYTAAVDRMVGQC